MHLDKLLAARGITLVELSAQVGVTVANLSILKNGHARAVRFSTLTALRRPRLRARRTPQPPRQPPTAAPFNPNRPPLDAAPPRTPMSR